VPPRLGKWVNEDNFIFVQLHDLAAPTAIRYFGVGSVGTFCAEGQPSTDFTHYHRFHAPEYREGHAGEPGEEDSFEARDGRQVVPGVDREFSPTPPPPCGEGAATPASASTASLTVATTEWRFDPATLHLRAGQSLTLSVTNAGAELHTFTVPKLGIDTGPLQPGATRELRLTAPVECGRYDALCTFPGHKEAGMTGSLVVE
jgi:plastocyanin